MYISIKHTTKLGANKISHIFFSKTSEHKDILQLHGNAIVLTLCICAPLVAKNKYWLSHQVNKYIHK